MEATERAEEHSPENHEQGRARLQKMPCEVGHDGEAQRDLVVGPEQLGACSQIIFASKSPSVEFVQLSHWVFSVSYKLHSPELSLLCLFPQSDPFSVVIGLN